MKCLTFIFTSVVFNFVKGGRVDSPHPDSYPLSILYRADQPTFCADTCAGLPDGNYHSCMGCYFFATCSKGKLHDGRRCAAFGGVFWNDYRKRCDFTSPSCNNNRQSLKPAKVSPLNCVSNCKGMPDGDYHSCTSCRSYITCTNGLNVDRRPCPWFLEWDDRIKRCEWISSTCILPRNSTKPVLWSWLK